MKDDKDRREAQGGGPAKNARQDRLRLALRENLKRRKSQARGRGDMTDTPSDDASGSLDDKRGKKPGV
jgi:hypothetical protein